MIIDWFDTEKYFFTAESVKINWFNSENLTDSDLESTETVFYRKYKDLI